MEGVIGNIVSKIDRVLIKLETMEKSKSKKKQNLGKLFDGLTNDEGGKRSHRRAAKFQHRYWLVSHKTLIIWASFASWLHLQNFVTLSHDFLKWYIKLLYGFEVITNLISAQTLSGGRRWKRWSSTGRRTPGPPPQSELGLCSYFDNSTIDNKLMK